jgi:hypothetical protein
VAPRRQLESRQQVDGGCIGRETTDVAKHAHLERHY